MRLGGQSHENTESPEGWVRQAQALGYRAVDCPLPLDAPDDVVAAYAQAAQQADLVIAEVGAWSNPLAEDEKERREALNKCCRALDLADRTREEHHFAPPH